VLSPIKKVIANARELCFFFFFLNLRNWVMENGEKQMKELGNTPTQNTSHPRARPGKKNDGAL
jgi:hypothetical protein